jgi:putative ABC transport system permease protein
LGLFAGLALLLSAIGIYGVMAYSVSARSRELGIRIALGAQAGDVLRLMLREGAALVLAGLALGLLAAWASLRVLQSQLYEMSTTDPLTFGVVSLLLVSVALLACYVPARRAMRTDLLATLRYE